MIEGVLVKDGESTTLFGKFSYIRSKIKLLAIAVFMTMIMLLLSLQGWIIDDVVDEIKKDLGFNVKNQVTADGLWMENNIKKFNIKKIYSVLTIFYLGGVSNLPSKRSLKMKANTGMISIIKELLKFSLLKIVGKNSFYRIIYCFKYDRVERRKIYK